MPASSTPPPHHLRAALPIRLTRNLPVVTPEAFGLLLSAKFQPAFDLLLALALEGCRLPPTQRAPRVPVSADALGTVMAVTLTTQAIDVPDDPSTGRPLRSDAVELLCNVAYGLHSSREREEDRDNSASDRVIRDFPRLVGIQGALDSDPVESIGRFALLTGAHEDASTPLGPNTELERVVLAEFDASAADLAGIAFTAWVVATKNPIFQIDRLFANFPDPTRITEAFAALLARASTPIEKAQAMVRGPLASLPPTAQAFDLFTRFPFLNLGRGWYLSAPHHYTRFFMGHRLFFVTREAARNQLGGSKHGPDDNPVNQELGKRFERYCFHVTAAALPTMTAMPEHRFERGQGSDSPDGVYLDHHNRECVLMQAKVRQPTRGWLLADPDSKRADDVGAVYARMIDQNVRYLIALQSAADARRLAPESELASQTILAARRWTFLCLCPQVPQVLHLPQFERLLRAELRKLMPPERFGWYERMRTLGRISTVHVDQIESIEYFAQNCSHLALPRKLRTWRQAVRLAMPLVTNPKASPVLPASFANYLRMRPGASKAVRLLVLQRAFRGISANIGGVLGTPVRWNEDGMMERLA